MTCRITESYEDISDIILNAVKDIVDPLERINKIKEKKIELEINAEKSDTTIQAEVSEMFAGKTYVLFRYKIIRDVRIVYVPPRRIGEFGGETDNWMWPRHTGDFSFLRAYVASNGSTAEYSPANVPYQPKKFLKIDPDGAGNNDFVFILGYPGRTYRQKTSQFLEFQQEYFLPYVSGLYDFEINVMEKLSAADTGTAIKLASRIKGLANAAKNYKGKLLGFRHLPLVENKKNEEREIIAYINKDPELKKRYGGLFHNMDSVYEIIFKNGKRDLWLQQVTNSSTLLRLADILLSNTMKTVGLTGQEKDSVVNDLRKRMSNEVSLLYQRFSLEADRQILKRMLDDALLLPKDTRIEAVDNIIKGKDTLLVIDDFIRKAINNNVLADSVEFYKMLDSSYSDLVTGDNLLISFANNLKNQIDANSIFNRKIDGTLDKLSAELLEIRQQYSKSKFIPDANSTLRLTYGHIKGYSPSDAVYCFPHTTLKGVIEKSYLGKPEYAVPDKLRVLFEKKDYGKFYSKELDGLPVAILYDTDTTGGNSGSPVMNAHGELIGVNFDRTFEATINDYAWNERYSRSIGVDIRYILWVTQKIGGADYLLDEMGVKN